MRVRVLPIVVLSVLAALSPQAAVPAAAQDGFGLPAELAGHAIVSCRELNLSGGAVVTSEGLRTGAAEGEQGHVRSNQGVVLDGGVEVHGHAVPGPGFAVTFHGQPSLVTGSTAPADDPFDCTPIDLATLRAELESSNDNGLLTTTAKGNPVLDGDDGRALRLSGRDSVALPAGRYLLSELRLTGNSSLTVAGPVRILVTGTIDVQGGSHLNLDGNPFDLLLFSSGDAASMASYAALHGFLYAPAAEIDLTGRSRVVGGVQGDRVEVSGGARVRRTVDDAPPVLDVSTPAEGQSVETCEIAVSGTASDGEGAVEVTVNGAPATVAVDGSFTGTASLWTDDPGLVVVEVVDGAGNVTRVEVRVSIVPPEAVLLAPAPGSLVGSRLADLSGRAGTATELTIDGIPAELPGDGTFRLSGFDLGEDGLVTLSLAASNCGGSVTATAVLDLDTRPPAVAIDAPPAGALFGATPIDVGGTVADAHLDRVTVGGVVATVEGGRFLASGVALAEGANTLVAVATDILGRSTTSVGVAVELDTTAPTIDILSPANGAVVATPTITVTGEASDPNLASVTVGGVTAQLSGSTFTATGVALQEGENFLVAEAVDSLGNSSESPSVVVVLDTLPPQVAIDAAALPGLTANGTVTVQGTVSDPHLDTVTVNGIEATVVGESFAAEGVVLSEGANPIVAEATDTLGHASASAPVTVTRDTLPPEITISEPAEGAELGERIVTVRGTVIEPHLDRITVGGVEAVVTDGVFAAEGVELPEGESVIVARGVDVLGHAADSPPVAVVVDTLAPVVRLASPQDPLVTTPTVDVAGWVEEPHLESVLVAGLPAELGEPDGASTPFTAGGVGLVEGPNEITATARDTLGHVATSAPVLYVLDTLPPEISIVEPVDGQVVATPEVLVRGTVADPNLDTVTVAGTAAAIADDGTFSATVPVVAGGNVLTAVAIDLAGHVSEASVTVLLDTLPPAVSIDAPAPGTCLPGGTPVTLTGAFVDANPATGLGGQPPAVQVAVTAANGIETAYVGDLTDGGTRWRLADVPLGPADGTATASVTATDLLGNAARTVASWRVDATAPTLVLTLDGAPFPGAGPGAAPAPGATPTLLGRTVAVGSRVDDGLAAAPPVAALTLDGVPYTAGTPISADGDHLVVATVTDCAGHTATAHALFRVDRAAPGLVSTDPAAAERRTTPVIAFSGVADEALTAASVDGRPAAIDGSGFALAPFEAAEGTNEVAVELVDLAGNRSSHTVIFELRTVPLGVEILENGAPLAEGAVFLRPARPEPRATDSRATLTATLDGAPFVPGSQVAEAGQHHLVATAEDDWGRTASAEVRFTVDLGAAPEIAITSPADGAVLDGATTPVSGTVTGDGVSVTVNGAPATVAGGTWSLGSLALEPNASTVIEAVARDTHGRSASAAVTVQVVAGGPQVLILEPPDGVLTPRDRIDVAGVVPDGRRASADGTVTLTGAESGFSATVPIAAGGSFRVPDVTLAAGSNTLRATVRDAQDREGADTVAVVADFAPPTISFFADGQPLADGATFGRPIELAVRVADDAGAPPVPVVRLNGVARAEAASPETRIAIAEEGGYVVSVVAFDAADNEARAERSFLVDFGGCALSEVHPPAGSAVTGSSVSLAGRSGSAAAVAVRVPDGAGGFQEYAAATADGTFLAGDVPLPAVGEIALVLVCTDAAGQERTQEHAIERLPAGDGPTVVIDSPADGALVDADGVTVSGTVSAGSVTVNGVPATVTPAAGDDHFAAAGVSLVEGPNVLGARAVDGAGRTGTDRVVVERDTQPPRAQITRPDHRSRVGRAGSDPATIDVGGVVDLDAEPNLDRVVVSSAGGQVTASVDPATGVFLAAGVPLDPNAGAEVPQTLTVTATDRLGHAGTSSVDVFLDPTGPAIVLDAPEDLLELGEDAPDSLTVSGDAWAAEGAAVSVNGFDLDPATLAWEPAGGDGRRHVRFATSIAVPSADGPFGVVARVTEQDGDWAQDRRLLYRDTEAPRVVEIVPADGTEGASPDSLVLVLFSEPVRHASLASSDGLSLVRASTGQAVVGSYTVAGQAVAFVPGAALAAGEGYVVRAGLGVIDRAGHPLAAAEEAVFTVATAAGAAAPVLDALPAVLCASEIVVTGSAAPSATVEVRDGDLVFRGNAEASGRFAVTVPAAGSGYHLLRVRALDPATGTASAEASTAVRIDCSAPRVVEALFDRDAARITVLFSEPLDPATVAVGDASAAVRLTDAEVADVLRDAALSFPAAGTLALDLDSSAGAWWRDRPVRLQVGPPAADAEGNPMASVFETVFFPGAGDGLAGGFLFGEAYDDTTGRPLAGATAHLYPAGVALPGTVAPGAEGAPYASAPTDGRGRFLFAGDAPSGRYVLLVEAEGYTRIHRRLSLAPARGLVPFDSRLTPRADTAGTIDPATGGAAGLGELTLAADPGALAGTDPVTLHLTPLSGQGLPDFLPLGWTPAAAAEVRAEAAGAPLASGPADWLPDGVRLDLPLPAWVAGGDELVAVRYDASSGRWISLPAPERLPSGHARVTLDGPGMVVLVVPDEDPATRPSAIPAVAGEVLIGLDPSAAPPAPDLVAELALDPPVVPPTGRSLARVVARSVDGTTPWPSGLPVQAYLEEKLILAGGGGQLLEAPYSADLVLYHPRLSAEEAAGALPGAAGAVEFVISPSPRAAQVLLDVGYENIRLFPFPEEVEREPVVGPPGGTVESPEGVELTIPEGALAVRVPATAELLDGAELAALPEVAGFDTLAAVRVDLRGHTLSRPATLSLPAPAATVPASAGDPRLVLAERIDAPTDGRGSFPRLAARARLEGDGEAARIVASPDQAGALPLDGLVREGLYLVLQARQPIGFVTGFVAAVNGTALERARVTADGLGTADVTPAGGRYAVPAPAGAGPNLRALHPTHDDTTAATAPGLAAGQVVSLDLVLETVAPTVLSVAPADGGVDQPVGSEVSVLFSEPLSPDTVGEGTLSVEFAGSDGQPTGLRVDGTVGVSADGTRVVFTPARPLLPGRTFRVRFAGGVADAAGTFYEGAPLEWSFETSTQYVTGGQVHPERFHVRVPENGVAVLYGEPGAVPSVPAGSTPWIVSPEIEAPAADPLRDSFAVAADGSFTGTVGHPPDFGATIASRVWVQVFDPSGALAAEFRLGPFETADGLGFVAPGGEEVVYRSAEGIEVTVPEGAFDEATIVRVRQLDSSTLGIATPAGMGLGAYVDLDFEGRATEGLRLAIPAPAGAAPGDKVFVGEPVALPWGRRLRILSVGGVESRADGDYLSNHRELQPAALRPAPTSGGISAGAPLTARSTAGGGAALSTKELPPRTRANLLFELSLRGSAAWFYASGATWTMAGGVVQSFGLAQGVGREAIYTTVADAWVYVPEPYDWNGGFVLPVLTDQPLEVVRRDTATGWILGQSTHAPIPPGEALVDVGTLDGDDLARPLLIGARPFRLVRFQAPGEDETVSLTLEAEARGAGSGRVEIAGSGSFDLAAGSRLTLYDFTPALPRDPETEPLAPIEGPAKTLCDATADWSLGPMAGGEEMVLVVSPGDLHPAAAGRFELQFDRPLEDLGGREVSEVARLVDLGPFDGCTETGGSAYPRDLPITLDQAENGSRLVFEAVGALPAGHRFRFELTPSALVSRGSGALSSWPSAPHRFEFATRELDGESLAGSPAGVPALGDTDVARDLLKLGNLLLVASENGELLAIDASDTTDAEGLRGHALMNEAASQIRTLETDGHGRIFYAGQYGPFWAVKSFRIEDAREATADCGGAPAWAGGLSCFDGLPGSVRIAYVLGYTSGMTTSEWLAAGTLPTGTPMDLSVLTQDEKGEELALGEFVETYGAGDLATLTPDADGVYTFDLALTSTHLRGGSEPSRPSDEPAEPIASWRETVCSSEEDYDRFQRATVDNLTTGESWSIDLENPWPSASDGGGGTGSGTVAGVRARRGDRLQVRYNLRTLGHVALLGSGVTVVDLNRFYRLPQEQQSPGEGQCGRRLGSYQGQEIEWPACAPGSIDLYSGLSTLPAVDTLGKTGCGEDDTGCRGTGSIDVYAPLLRVGALHASSQESDPGALSPQAELAACIDTVDGVGTMLRDVAIARDVPWVDRGVTGTIDGSFQESSAPAAKEKQTDLLALSLGRAGIYVFDVSNRSLRFGPNGPALVGHLRVPGHTAYRLQVDPVRHLLFAGGTDERTGEPIIDVWDLASSNGAPEAGVRPVPVASLHTAWTTNHVGIDATDTGLVYTWDREAGAQVAPFESPRFTFTGLYREEDDESTESVHPVEKPTSRFVPLGVPFHPEGGESDVELADEREATAAFKLRVALPGALGPELTAKVQSLRALPGDRHLGAEDVGAAVQPPGGPSEGPWPDQEVVVRLRRLSPDGAQGALGATYHLYESVETVLLVADPRARRGYRRQDAPDGEDDEEGQCRRCEWPAYLPDPDGTDPALDRVEELLAGRFVRAFLFADDGASPVGGAAAAESTRAAIDYFESRSDNYPLPSGWAEVLAPAAAVPSPYQVSLAEPAASPAVWDAGEAGVAAALTGGELLLTATDHAVAGRSLPFVFSRSYRSGTLGYGPLGAAGWWSPLFARVRELPNGEAEYHDGAGRVWRFPPKSREGDPPDGYEADDDSASYDVPEGLYVRLIKQAGGIGWVLQHRDNSTLRFDGEGRLLEIADRLYQAGTKGDVGNRLRFGYDAFGQLVSIVDDLGRRHRLEYHDDPRPVGEGGDGPRYGLLEKVIDFADREIEYRWDEERRLTEVRLPEVENPTSAYGSFSYAGASRPTVTYEYEPAQNVTASETASGALLHGDFASLRLASFELPPFQDGAASEPRARFAYDSGSGRLASIAFPGELSAATWTLDSVGGAAPASSVTVTAPWGHAMEHVLEDGRVKVFREALEVYQMGGGGGQQSLETRFDYAPDGRLVSTVRPDGSAESLCYTDGEGGAGCDAGSGSASRMQRTNVTARVVRATTPEAQGTADYGQVVTRVGYHSDNLPERVTDGRSRDIHLPVAGVETEETASYPEGVTGTFTYDPYGRPKTEAWGGTTGRRMEIEYGEDERGRAGAGLVKSVRMGSDSHLGSSQELEYDNRYNVTVAASSFGRHDTTTYDLWDRPVREVMGESSGSLAAVGAKGACESSGAVVERAFDAAGHLVRTRHLQDVAEGDGNTCRWVEERYLYNAREQLVAIERSHLADPSTPGGVLSGLRRVMELSYDEHGRLAETRALADAHEPVVTSYRYDSAGRVASTTVGAQAERTVGYDARSRTVFRSDGDEGVWEGRFDAWGRLYEERLPTGAKVTTRYDAAHNVAERTVTGEASSAGEEPAVLAHTSYEVTSFGGVTEQREDLTASGGVRVTRQEFDEAGRVKFVAVGGTVPGAGGESEAIPERRQVEIVYEDVTGRVRMRKYGGSVGGTALYEERYGYGLGAAPWPDSMTARESIPGAALEDTFTTTYTLDVFGRAIASERTDGERREMTYERGSGALLRSSTGAGAETVITRDGRGLPVRSERPDGRGFTLSSYDLDGLLLIERTATADGATVWQTARSYDGTGRLIGVSYSDGTQETQTYHPDSTVATRTTRDGITLTYTYDAANRPLGVTPSGATGTTRLDAGDAYAWDALSRPTRLERGRPGVGGLDPSLALSYPSYDLGSRPAAEVVGQREPLTWSWDVFDRPSELRLPSGVGRDVGGAFTGFSRGYDSLDRLTSAGSLGADPSPTTLGADWQWGGLSRLYAMTTRGALGTGVRLGYHGGAGPSAPAGAVGTAAWKLGRMSWGAAAGTGPTDAPATPWGDLGFGWRGHDGLASDGAKLGRQVLGSPSSDSPGLLAGQGWAWGYDAGVRMTVAESGSGSLVGASTDSGAAAADRFTYSYGTGDELLWSLRRETGELASYTSGPYGRIESREGATFDHDPAGRRLSDDRFTYRWDWRGQLVEVTVHDTWPNSPDEDGDGAPDATPYAGHRVRYDYDARGRLLRRLHEGGLAGDGSRPFVEERRYVWEMDRLAAETAYGAPGTGVGGDGAIRWRKTFVPGPSGLDDAPQVVVEVYQPGSYTGTTCTYTYVTDEMGTTLGIVAEDEGGTATQPPVPVRYLYTPYGQAHAETGPELLRVRFDAQATSVDSGTGGAVTQVVPDTTEAAPGALVLTWSSPIAESSLPAGLHVERLAAGEGWVPVPETEFAVGTTPSADPLTDTSTELRVLRLAGWQEATSYRVRLTPALADRLGRPFGSSETLQWTIPAAPSAEEEVPPPQYEQRYPRRYESYEAAGATVGGRFPGGQSRLFQGLWTDPVTGISYARARWLDTRTGQWLSEDPLFDIDSPNLYAFVGWRPSMGRDPLGTYIVGGKEEAELIRSVFEKAGAPELAAQIRLSAQPVPREFRDDPNVVTWETRITNDFAEWTSSLDGEPLEQLAWLFDMLIDEEMRFEFSITTSKKGHGGYAIPEEEPSFHYELGVNPSLIPDARVVVMGPDGKISVKGTIPDVEAVVVHELGHGFGRTIGGVGYFTQEIEYSLHFENIYRQLTTPAEQWPTIRLYEYRREELSEYSRQENAVKDVVIKRFFKPRPEP